MSSAPDPTSRVLRRERLVVAGVFVLLVALSWWFLASGAGLGDHMGMHAMQPPFGALVLMWWLMMLAMMLPSTAPMVLLYARVREHRGAGRPVVQPVVFVFGYIAVWLLFSVAAAAAQQWLAGSAMMFSDPRVGSALLIGAGLYQVSPLKSACLSRCRSPAQFLSSHWRPGFGGAVRLGMWHGAYCVGCCWLLMALLFVGGVMNLAWIAGLALIVTIERLAPRGEWIGRAAGVALVVWGLVRLAGT